MSRTVYSVLISIALLTGCGQRSGVQSEQYNEPRVGISLVAPAGWQIADTQYSVYKIMHGEPSGGFAVNMNITTEDASESIDEYMVTAEKSLMQATTNYKRISLGSFVTKDGRKLAKLVAEDTMQNLQLRQTIFVFDDAKKKKHLLTWSCLQLHADRYDATFDAAMKTMVFTPPN